MNAQKVILDLTALIVFGDGRWMGCLKIIRKIENVDSLKLYISMKYKLNIIIIDYYIYMQKYFTGKASV